MLPSPRRFVAFLILFLHGAALLAGCALPQPAPEPVDWPLSARWAYADLRLLDRADSTQPELDLLAAYVRYAGPEVQVRLDLLEMAASPAFDLYLALDTSPGGGGPLPMHPAANIAWDALLVIQAAGPVRAFSPGGPGQPPVPRSGMGVRVLRDPIQDTLEVSLRRSGLDEPAYGPPDFGFSLQVFLTPPGRLDAADILGPLRSDGQPPPQAPALLAFWNTLPAYSPAQTLRRWDGAHTGPLGGRHGLYNLLRTARAARLPLALLDLKTPSSLSALDFAGGVELVGSMARDGLLILPQPLPGSSLSDPQPDWAIERALAGSRDQDRLYGLPASPFLFAASGSLVPDSRARVVFALQTAGETLAPVSLGRWQGRVYIPIPYAPGQAGVQATLDGPAPDVKRLLVQAALNASRDGSLGSSPVLVLGGDLPASTWGEPRSARATLRYLSAHPWVRLIGAGDLLAARPGASADFPALPPSTVPLSPTPISPVSSSPLPLSPGAPSQAAWQAYYALSAPVYPAAPELPALHAVYRGQARSLQAAIDWDAAGGQPSATCSTDPDEDGQPECILASGNFFALFELDGATLAYAFSRSSGSSHQIVAPTSELIVGQSDPASWDLARGLAADPAVIPGAFSGPSGRYLPALGDGQLTLIAPDGSLRKVFRLTSQGLRVEYQYLQAGAAPRLIQLPLALDPWLRFAPGWAARYSAAQTDRGWVWQVQEGVRVEVSSSAPLTLHSFNDSRRLFDAPEDPNQDYPPGHALLYPLAMVEVAASGNFFIQIDVFP